MKKEVTRDYATGAFVWWYKVGRITRREMEAQIAQDVARRYSLHPPDFIAKKTEREIVARRMMLDDLSAVCTTMDMLRGEVPLPDGFTHIEAQRRGEEIARAVEAVYFGLHRERQRKKRIEARVLRFALDNGISERTVYRRLKLARRLFAHNRGLSVEFD